MVRSDFIDKDPIFWQARLSISYGETHPVYLESVCGKKKHKRHEIMKTTDGSSVIADIKPIKKNGKPTIYKSRIDIVYHN